LYFSFFFNRIGSIGVFIKERFIIVSEGEAYMDLKTSWKRFWHFIWEEDSLLSWIANIVLAIILIKFILFPVLGFILGSEFPLVAVVSSSMEHDGSFDQWWTSQAVCGTEICTQEEFYDQFDISKEVFKEFRFANGFNKGDVMVLVGTKGIEVGDTVVFFSRDGRPIIHRVVDLDPLQTKGDHNVAQIADSFINEKDVSQHPLIGKAAVRIPFIGYVKIAFVEFLSLFGVTVR
jgi:signal peptidase I